MVSKPCGFRTAPAIQDSCPETRKRHLSSVTRGLPPHGMGRWIARRARRRGRRSKAEPELGADAPPLRADSAHRPTSPSNGEEATPSPPAGRGIKGEGIKGEGRAALAAQGKSLWKALSRCPSSGACAPPSPRWGRRGIQLPPSHSHSRLNPALRERFGPVSPFRTRSDPIPDPSWTRPDPLPTPFARSFH